MWVNGWVNDAVEVHSHDVVWVFIGKVGKATFNDVTKRRRGSSRHWGRVDRKDAKCRGFRKGQQRCGDEAFMVVVWNWGSRILLS